MHVWQPPEVNLPRGAKIALAPVAGDPQVARQLEQQLLAQRPAAKADVAIFTAEQLVALSPVRLASTDSLSNDIVALNAARAADADVLLHGEILRLNLDFGEELPKNEPVNMNLAFFQRFEAAKSPEESLLIGWRVVDVATGKHLGDHSINASSRRAAKQYPELLGMHQDATDLLLAATARETWKTISPVVVKQKVRLAKPSLLSPAVLHVKRGNNAAKLGQWQIAQANWKKATQGWLPSASAHHNLALAHVANENFVDAKKEIERAYGIFGNRLPTQTPYWIDQQHRRYNKAHEMGVPTDGWSFVTADMVSHELKPAKPLSLEETPWLPALSNFFER